MNPVDFDDDDWKAELDEPIAAPPVSRPPAAKVEAPVAAVVGGGRRSARSFVLVWTLAVLATVAAFVVELSLRGKSLALGYELGRARSEEVRLREVKRVLSIEASSYKTPERVDVVARTLLGMEQPPRERVIPLGPVSLPGPVAKRENP